MVQPLRAHKQLSTSRCRALAEHFLHVHFTVWDAARICCASTQHSAGDRARDDGNACAPGRKPATLTELCVCWPPSTPSSLVVGAGVVNGTPPRSSTPKVAGAERLREPVAPGRLAPLPAGQFHVSVWQITGAAAVTGTLPGLFTSMITGAEKLQKLEGPERCGSVCADRSSEVLSGHRSQECQVGLHCCL